MRVIISTILFLSLLSTNTLKSQEISSDLQQLADWMTGEFDSSEQADKDSSYYNISLKMTRIWPEKTNGIYLYVEQALASTPKEPYRQRVYFVTQIDDLNYTSDVYTFKNAEKFIGAWKTPESFADVTVFDLKYKEGCTVFMDYDGFQYSGRTKTGSCKSDLRGASYATSEVIILPSKLSSWDRGYDENDEQVWGAEKGPYVFKKE